MWRSAHHITLPLAPSKTVFEDRQNLTDFIPRQNKDKEEAGQSSTHRTLASTSATSARCFLGQNPKFRQVPWGHAAPPHWFPCPFLQWPHYHHHQCSSCQNTIATIVKHREIRLSLDPTKMIKITSKYIQCMYSCPQKFCSTSYPPTLKLKDMTHL